MFLIVLITAFFRTPTLDVPQLDEDAEAEEDEGLLASTGRRFGAAWGDITGETPVQRYLNVNRPLTFAKGRASSSRQAGASGTAGRGVRDRGAHGDGDE